MSAMVSVVSVRGEEKNLSDLVATVRVAGVVSDIAWRDLSRASQAGDEAGDVYRYLRDEALRVSQGHPPQMSRDMAAIARQATEARAAAAEKERRLAEARAKKAAEARAKKIAEAEAKRVSAARSATADDDPWWPITSAEVVTGVRFDTPAANAGQIVEVSYGTFGRSEADECDMYMRVEDRSDRSVRFYRRRRFAR